MANPLYGQNKSDDASASAFIETEIVTISGANVGYAVAPFNSKVLSVSYILTTATTVADTVMTLADGDGNSIATLTIPVKAINKGGYFSGLDGDADAKVAAGEVVSLTSDGGSTAGAGKFIVQFQAA